MLPTIVENNNDTVIGIRNGIFGVTHILVLPAASSWLICSSVESSDLTNTDIFSAPSLMYSIGQTNFFLASGRSIM